VHSFAYPFGYYSRPIREMVEEAGYRSACAVHDLVGTARDDRFAVPRLTVNAGTDVAGLAELLGREAPSRARYAVVDAKRLVWQGLRRHAPARVTTSALRGTPRSIGGRWQK